MRGFSLFRVGLAALCTLSFASGVARAATVNLMSFQSDENLSNGGTPNWNPGTAATVPAGCQFVLAVFTNDDNRTVNFVRLGGEDLTPISTNNSGEYRIAMLGRANPTSGSRAITTQISGNSQGKTLGLFYFNNLLPGSTTLSDFYGAVATQAGSDPWSGNAFTAAQLPPGCIALTGLGGDAGSDNGPSNGAHVGATFTQAYARGPNRGFFNSYDGCIGFAAYDTGFNGTQNYSQNWNSYSSGSNAVISIVIHPYYTITASAGANGTISPSGASNFEALTNRTYTITPNAGYRVATLTVDGVVQTNPAMSYTFSNITADHTISATFALPDWTFNTAGYAEGWGVTGQNDVSGVSVSGGNLNYTSGASDPFLGSQFMALPETSYSWYVINARNGSAASQAIVFWDSDLIGGYTGGHQQGYEIVPNDDQVSEYWVNVASNANWTGATTIESLRNDFPDNTGTLTGAIVVDRIRLSGTGPAAPNVVSITQLDAPGTVPAPNTGTPIRWKVRFDHNMTTGATLLNTNNYSFPTTGSASVGSVSITGKGPNWVEVSVAPSGLGTIGLNVVTGGSARDVANQPLAAGSTGPIYTIDRLPNITPQTRSVGLYTPNTFAIDIQPSLVAFAGNGGPYTYTLDDDQGGRFALSTTSSPANVVVADHAAILAGGTGTNLYTILVTADDGVSNRQVAVPISVYDNRPTINAVSRAVGSWTPTGFNIDSNPGLAVTFPATSPTLPVNYSLSNNDGNRFQLSGSNIQVNDHAVLSATTAGTRTITVSILINGTDTVTQTQNITLNNTNPVITAASRTVNDALGNGNNITTGSAIAVTNGGPSSYTYTPYTITVSPSDANGGAFAISGGAIQVGNTALIDYGPGGSGASRTLKIRIEDQYGQIIEIDQGITVFDGTAPVVTVQNLSKNLGSPSASQVQVNASEFLVSFSDNGGETSVGINDYAFGGSGPTPPSFPGATLTYNCSNTASGTPGPQSLFVWVRDARGVVAGPFNVSFTAVDVQPPVLQATSTLNRVLNRNNGIAGDGLACYAALPNFATLGLVAHSSGSPDNCGANGFEYRLTSDNSVVTPGYLLLTSPTQVAVRARDVNGNTSTVPRLFNITLNDISNPQITATPPNVVRVRDTNNCTQTVPDFIAGTSVTDNCAYQTGPAPTGSLGPLTILQSPPEGTVITDPVNIVTIVARDTVNRLASTGATVTLIDTNPPVISDCGIDITVSKDGNCSQLVPNVIDSVLSSVVASDECESVLGPITITQSPVAGSPLTLAETTVTITVTDAEATSAENPTAPNQTTCTKNISLRDTTKPIIILNPGQEGFVTGEPYIELGAFATDNCDGWNGVTHDNITLLPANIDNSSVNINVQGIYFVTYNYTDAAGNAADTVTRAIQYSNNRPPQITMVAPAPITPWECHTPYVDPGATAVDPETIPLDLTANITFVPGFTPAGVDYETPGDYQVKYTVTDVGGGTTTATRTVRVQDTTPPVPVVTGANPASVECHTEYTDEGATATDLCSAINDITIETDNPITINTPPGTYAVTYTAIDESNNTFEITRTVNVVDTTDPEIQLIGDPSVNHECGAAYNDLGATVSDTCESGLLANVDNPVDTNSNSGSYTVTYTVTDAGGNAALPITRAVIVSDNTPPTITLNGAASYAVNLGQPYNEPGANAFDLCDGALTVVIGGQTVNTNVPGNYVVTYNATDAAGFPAVQKTRSVIVQGSNDAPIILQQPTNQTANFSASAQFHAVAASPVLITFKWRRNNVDLVEGSKYSGTTSDTLTVNNCANADEGNFTLVATNQFGSVTTDIATLTVADPAITTEPTDVAILINSNTSFNTIAVGSGSLTYQWFKSPSTQLTNGAKYQNVTTNTLGITNAIFADEGTYYCRVTGADGVISTRAATLNIANPAVTTQPQPQTVDPGDDATFSVVAGGTPPLLYRWRKDGVNLNESTHYVGTTTNTLTVKNCTEADEGLYRCVVVGTNIVPSAEAQLKVNDPPVLGLTVVNPFGGVFSPGGSGTLSVTIDAGTPPLTIQWKKNGTPILTKTLGVDDKSVFNGNAEVLNVNNAQDSDEGVYTCTVSNSAGTATTDPITIIVGLNLFVDLLDRTGQLNQPFSWSFGVAGGIGDITFNWYKFNSSNVPVLLEDQVGVLFGSGTSTLQFTSLQNSDDGRYKVTVSDTNGGFVESRIARLRIVNQLPVSGALGLAVLTALAALIGVTSLRQKKQDSAR